MQHAAMPDSSDLLAEGVPAVLRRVAPPAAPWPAGIVRTAAGSGLLVDLAELSDCAFGPPAEHVARPSEIFRTREGHLALLPALSRPLVAGALSPGAAVTLAVSVLRGIREAGAGATGRWWLTDGGAPVLVPVRGGDDAASAGAALVRALAAPGMPPVFAELSADLDGLVDLDDEAVAQWEERLFGAAVPAPVGAPALDASPLRRRSGERSAHGTVALLRAFDGGIAAAVSDAAASLGRTLRGLRGRRAPVAIAAAAVAAGVLVVGLGWPAADAPPAGTADAATGAPAQRADDPARPASAAPAAGEELGAVAAELAARLRSCGDPGCRAGILEDPRTALPEGGAMSIAEARLTIVDDLGGIAVVRADAAGHRSQIVVMVARDDTWLVRDVYDVTDQP